jgi:hypothetical protein
MPTFDDESTMAERHERPVCRSLRTKALHVYGPDTPDAYATSRSSHYHCLRTQFVTGPDQAPCVPEQCQPGRSCFEAR